MSIVRTTIQGRDGDAMTYMDVGLPLQEMLGGAVQQYHALNNCQRLEQRLRERGGVRCLFGIWTERLSPQAKNIGE